MNMVSRRGAVVPRRHPWVRRAQSAAVWLCLAAASAGAQSTSPSSGSGSTWLRITSPKRIDVPVSDYRLGMKAPTTTKPQPTPLAGSVTLPLTASGTLDLLDVLLASSVRAVLLDAALVSYDAGGSEVARLQVSATPEAATFGGEDGSHACVVRLTLSPSTWTTSRISTSSTPPSPAPPAGVCEPAEIAFPGLLSTTFSVSRPVELSVGIPRPVAFADFVASRRATGQIYQWFFDAKRGATPATMTIRDDGGTAILRLEGFAEPKEWGWLRAADEEKVAVYVSFYSVKLVCGTAAMSGSTASAIAQTATTPPAESGGAATSVGTAAAPSTEAKTATSGGGFRLTTSSGLRLSGAGGSFCAGSPLFAVTFLEGGESAGLLGWPGERPGPGTYTISEDLGPKVFSLGFMKMGHTGITAKAGTLTLETSTPTRVSGKFAFSSEMSGPDGEEKEVRVTGTFAAVATSCQ